MEREELIVYKTRDRQRVEGLHEQVVRLRVVLVQTLRPEIEEGRHLATLVVSSEHVDRLRKIQLSVVVLQVLTFNEYSSSTTSHENEPRST